MLLPGFKGQVAVENILKWNHYMSCGDILIHNSIVCNSAIAFLIRLFDE